MFIAPSHVVKVQPWQTVQGVDSVIVVVTGDPEIVKGPPSEVNKRLRTGQ